MKVTDVQHITIGTHTFEVGIDKETREVKIDGECYLKLGQPRTTVVLWGEKPLPFARGEKQDLCVGTGGQGGASPPTFQGGGGGRRSPLPHFRARTYRKIPPGSLFFQPHNSTVLTPNQSVRCFWEVHRRRDPGGAGDPAPCVSPVRVWGGGVAPHAGSPFGPVFQCPSI